MNKIYDDLIKLSSQETKKFNEKLIPNISKDLILGVKIPEIRKYAKTLSNDEAFIFMKSLPHKSLEENILHMILIDLKCKDIEEVFDGLDSFVPYIISWADCDIFRCKFFKMSNKEKIRQKLISYALDNRTYVCRFGIVMLLDYFLGDNFDSNDLMTICKIDYSFFEENYYVKMAISWYVSMAVVKNYDEAIIVLENNILDEWVHNKTIQKCLDSLCLSKETKEYLKTLRRK